MNTNKKSRFAVSAVSLAVRSALVLMCAASGAALAQDAGNDDLKALLYPINYFDMGVTVMSTPDSTKFGEYNGLNHSGLYLIGNFNVRGGDAYGMGSGRTYIEASGTTSARPRAIWASGSRIRDFGTQVSATMNCAITRPKDSRRRFSAQ